MSKMDESALIKLFSTHLKNEFDQTKESHHADVEWFNVADVTMAISIDEFSKEDGFSTFHPRSLGFNIVMATLSDLIATGANPRYLLNSFSYSNNYDESFYQEFVEGMKECLDLHKVTLLGGDTSHSADWHMSCVAIGDAPYKLARTGLMPGDTLFSTGKFGLGNRLAFLNNQLELGLLPQTHEMLNLVSDKLPSRYESMKAIRTFAHAAIDTSDGYLNSLLMLSKVNPHVKIVAHYQKDLVESKMIVVTERVNLPAQIALIGGAGEYEVLVAVGSAQLENFLIEMKKMAIPLYNIGNVEEGEGLTMLVGLKKVPLDLLEAPDPRVMSRQEYMAKIMALHERIKNG